MLRVNKQKLLLYLRKNINIKGIGVEAEAGRQEKFTPSKDLWAYKALVWLCAHFLARKYCIMVRLT